MKGRLLYLCCSAAEAERVLEPALAGGVDVVQLRDKTLDDAGLLRAAERFRAAADRHGALFILNDRPDLVAATGADGVHVGQDDAAPAEARALAGPQALIGRSTHAPAQGSAAAQDPDVGYVVCGPVHATPTKPGRPAAGIGYVEWAAAQDWPTPWWAIGGIDERTIGPVLDAGARRVVVVRAITAAADPEAAARALRARVEAHVGVA